MSKLEDVANSTAVTNTSWNTTQPRLWATSLSKLISGPSKESGPRGNAEGRPEDIYSLINLILLCPECHHQVDDVRPADYSVKVLKKFKHDHEDRVFALTGLTKTGIQSPSSSRALSAIVLSIFRMRRCRRP